MAFVGQVVLAALLGFAGMVVADINTLTGGRLLAIVIGPALAIGLLVGWVCATKYRSRPGGVFGRGISWFESKPPFGHRGWLTAGATLGFH